MLQIKHFVHVIGKLYVIFNQLYMKWGPSWSYGSWIYNYLCNQCLSPLTLWVWTPLRRGVLNTILCDKVSHWLVTGLWLTLGTPVSSTNKTDRHDITEILLKVALNTITLTLALKYEILVKVRWKILTEWCFWSWIKKLKLIFLFYWKVLDMKL